MDITSPNYPIKKFVVKRDLTEENTTPLYTLITINKCTLNRNTNGSFTKDLSNNPNYPK